MRARTRPNSSISLSSNPPTLLTYAPQVVPSPLTVSPSAGNSVLATLTVAITNQTQQTVSVGSIIFTLQVGGDGASLTASTDSILTSISDTVHWALSPPSSTVNSGPANYTLNPASGTTARLDAGASISVTFYGFPTNTQAGTTTIQIKEISGSSTRFDSFQVSTFPYGFWFDGLAACVANGGSLIPVAQVGYGDSVTLTWNASVDELGAFTIYYSDPVSGPQTGTVTTLGQWVSPALFADTTFVVVAETTGPVGVQLPPASLAITVSVLNPGLTLTSLTVDGPAGFGANIYVTNPNYNNGNTFAIPANCSIGWNPGNYFNPPGAICDGNGDQATMYWNGIGVIYDNASGGTASSTYIAGWASIKFFTSASDTTPALMIDSSAAVAIGGSLSVAGTVAAGGLVTASDGLSITGGATIDEATIGGSLSVAGTVAAGGLVTASDGLSITGGATIDEATIGGSLSVAGTGNISLQPAGLLQWELPAPNASPSFTPSTDTTIKMTWNGMSASLGSSKNNLSTYISGQASIQFFTGYTGDSGGSGGSGSSSGVSPIAVFDVYGNLQLYGKVVRLSTNQSAIISRESLDTDQANSILSNLNPIRFTTKIDRGYIDHLGFAAEDLPDEPPRSGSGVVYDEVVAVLARVVKDQRTKLLELEARIKAIE